VAEFLRSLVVVHGVTAGWLPARWEYMHHHPLIDEVDLSTFGVAEDGGEVAGVAHLEHHPAYVYVQSDPRRPDVVEPLVDWIEHRFGGESRSFGGRVIGVYVAPTSARLAGVLGSRGFEPAGGFEERYTVLPAGVEPNRRGAPPGYRVQSLQVENDLQRINQVLWKGFGHSGPAPSEEIPGRARVQSAPGFRPDLTFVAVAADDSYTSYAGIWCDDVTGLAYVEPVATDPDHRRRGLAGAVLSTAIDRARAAGAGDVWVGADLPVYRSLGFRPGFVVPLWVRRLPGPRPES
jgi:predicted N-acetyltransferase YhbS